MTSAEHHEAAGFLIDQAEREADNALAVRLLELAAWHEIEAETKALTAVEPV